MANELVLESHTKSKCYALGNDLELVKEWDRRAAIPSLQRGEPYKTQGTRSG